MTKTAGLNWDDWISSFLDLFYVLPVWGLHWSFSFPVDWSCPTQWSCLITVQADNYIQTLLGAPQDLNGQVLHRLGTLVLNT